MASRSLRRAGVAAASVTAASVLARRLGRPAGANVVVRCSQGHLFTTIWLPGASLKAVRLGRRRLQRCPVGHHWALVTPVPTDQLSAEEVTEARLHHDVHIP